MTSVGTVLSYPIPAYQNLPIEAQFYQPSRFVISAIDEGPTTLITTSVNHNYVIGQDVRLNIPVAYGAYELNSQSGVVIDIPAANQVTLNINSINMDAFNPTPVFVLHQDLTQPQIIAIGDFNSGVTNSSGISQTGTFIPGSFQNISPL